MPPISWSAGGTGNTSPSQGEDYGIVPRADYWGVAVGWCPHWSLKPGASTVRFDSVHPHHLPSPWREWLGRS